MKKRLCDKTLWNIDYGDIEEVYALHRFGWLLVAYVEERLSSKEAIKYIEKWNVDNDDFHDIGWDSYSISERLSNWVNLLYVINYKDIEREGEIIRNCIFQQAKYLMQKLEFRGPATNNHIINNGRALYLVGLYLNNETFKKSGKEILFAGVDQMFTNSGFLREGSSHYHILLTRTYLEVLIFSRRFKDNGFGELLSKRIEKIWEAACFFLEENPFPIFGDVSPDYLTSFHLGLAEVGSCLFAKPCFGNIFRGTGWHNLFPDVIKEKSFLQEPKNGLVDFLDAGYIKFRNKRVTFYTHINPLGYVPSWSHGQADLGGYIFYLDRKCILVGTGRRSYSNKPLLDYWRSAKSHNSITIDNKALCPVHGLDSMPEFIFPDYFQKPIVEIKENDNCDGIEVKLLVKRVLSYDEEIEVIRQFLINDDALIVEDQFVGKGKHLITSYFHFSANFNLESNENNLAEIPIFDESNEQKLLFSFTDDSNIQKVFYTKEQEKTFGWCSPEYGLLEPCNTVIFKHLSSLPLKSTYRFFY